jgi:hypothetical protein
MPYESVSLIAPLDDCEGGLGDGLGGGGVGVGGGPEVPIYPSAEFVPVNCCFIADFNLACQEYTKNCAVLATIQTDISAKFEYYRRRIPYLANGNDPVSCPCELIQSNLVSEQTIHKAWWLERHKLVGLRVHVGKIRVQCEGGESACKFYVAVSYIFEQCEFVLGWATGGSFFAEFTNSYDCTGVYRDGTCSFSNQFENSSTINDCNDLMAAFPAQYCNEFQQKIISRIKIFDTLPTGQISISDADYPPLSCCGGSTGCTITGSPCGLSIIDNCMPNLPQFDEPFPAFCQASLGQPPYEEGCEIVVGCPVIREIPFPENVDDRCFNYFIYNESVDCFVLVGGQGAGSGNLIESTVINCGYCIEDGQTVWADAPLILLDQCAPGATLCLTGECCQNELVNSIQFVCQEFYEGLCATVISDLECEVGEPQYFTGGAFCFNLPTVTIQLT